MPNKIDYIYWHYYPRKTKPHASFYPIISNVQATSSGIITWTTDIASTSQVFYGLVPYLGFNTSYDSTLVTSHSVQLLGLTVGLIYYFKVQSFYWDSLSISDLYSFVVGAASGPAILTEDGVTYILLEDGTRVLLEP